MQINEKLTPIARRVPWWLILVVGLLCAAIGIALALRPLRSLSLMTWLIAASLLLVGVSRLLAAGATTRPWLSVLVGVVWLVAGLLVIVLPGLTIVMVTVVIAIVLLISGASHLVAALLDQSRDRLVLAIGGLAQFIFGLLALAAPAVTVLVLAIFFAAYVALFGLRQILLALRLRRGTSAARTADAQRWPQPWRLAGAIISLVVALVGVAALIAVQSAQPDAPGSFYMAPAALPDGPPGTIVRSEVIDDFYDGATAYRVLYTSTSYDGQPTAVSGIVVVPDGNAPADGRKIVAWTHGTVGVAANCAQSLIAPSSLAPALPALDEFMDAGYIYVATDYQGLGTPGPSPYLVGASEGMNALDSVRAAINLPGTNASNDFVVWGESQGGHASLFTGQLAATYAPELNLRGVVASAPASDLLDLFKTKIEKSDAIGNMLLAMAASSWARVYDDVDLNSLVFPAARPLVNAIAENCIHNPAQIQASLPASVLLTMRFFSRPPWEFQTWNDLIVENTPGDTTTLAPILVQQGQIDQVISPAVQAQFVEKLCVTGDTVEYRTYPGVGHLTIAHDTASEVVRWITDRFAGVPPATSCDHTSTSAADVCATPVLADPSRMVPNPRPS